MTRDAIKADRYAEVRNAARSWRRAQLIDETGLSVIDETYPDDRVRVGPFFRLLLFFLTFFGSLFVGAAAILTLDSRIYNRLPEGYLVLMGSILLAITEYQIRILKKAQAGTEAATSAAGILVLLAGTYFLLDWDTPKAYWLLFWSLGFACACIRWGYEIYGLFSAGLFFLFLAHLPGARLWWGLAAGLFLYPGLRFSEHQRSAPSHRRALSLVLMVLIGALYMTVNIRSLDLQLIECELPFAHCANTLAVSSLLRGFSILFTGLVPLASLWYGLRTRRRLFLNVGLLTGILSLVTIRFYFQIAPLSIILIAAGCLALGGALLLRRWLIQGPGHERFGFTADPLLENTDRRSALETVAGALTFTPSAGAPPREPNFQGGGGASGGAGAGGAF